MWLPDQQVVCGDDDLGFKLGDDLDEVQLLLPAHDAPGQGDHVFSGQLRVLLLPLLQPLLWCTE